MIYVHREGPVTAGDTRVALATQGAVTAPGTIIVPPGCTKLTQIIAAVGDNTPTGADGGHNYFITLSGTGMAEGDQSIGVGASFSDFTTAGETGIAGRIFALHEVDINVIGGKTISIYAEATLGVLWGQPEFGITLGFA